MTKQIEEVIRNLILRNIQNDPSSEAAAIRSFIETEAVEEDFCFILANPKGRLQNIFDRYAGQRDILYPKHPIIKHLSDRLRRDYGYGYQFNANLQLRPPDIQLHVLVRWHFLSGLIANFNHLYAGNRAYDADHMSDELAKMLLDFTLQDVIAAMVYIYAISPQFYWAVWIRDDAAVEDYLIEFKDRLPKLDCFRYERDPAEKIRLLMGAAYEFEHGYELICALTSITSPSVSSLRATMTSPQAYAAAVHASGATAGYLSGTWLHQIPLQLHLQHKAASMKAAHPWQQYSRQGNRNWRGQKGAMADIEMFKVNQIVHTLVPPMGLRDYRVKNVNGLAPAHSFFGFDPVRLAIALVLAIANRLPRHIGGSNPNAPYVKYPKPEFYGAIGRLALNIVAHASPRTAQDIFDDTVRRMPTKSPAQQQIVSVVRAIGMPAMMSNPAAWTSVHNANALANYPSLIAEASLELGHNAFENMVKEVKKHFRNLTLPRNGAAPSAKIDDALRFNPKTWFEKKKQIAQLRLARSVVPTKYLTNLPKLFPQNAAYIDDFALKCAGEIWPALTPLAEDPIYRLTPDIQTNCPSILLAGLLTSQRPKHLPDFD